MTLEQPDEITVLGQHDGVRRSRRVEDVLIRGVTKLEILPSAYQPTFDSIQLSLSPTPSSSMSRTIVVSELKMWW